MSVNQEAEKHKESGNAHFKKKEFDQALSEYEKAIQIDPNEITYYNNKAACYIEQGKYDEAMTAVDKAIEILRELSITEFMKVAKVYARKGKIFCKQGDYRSGIEWYNKSLLEDNNENVKVDLREATKCLKEQEENEYHNPELGEEANARAKDHFQAGRWPDAIAEYTDAIRRNKMEPKYYCNRGISYVKLMEFVTALKDFDKCLELDPKYVKAWAKKGNCHFMMKEYHRSQDAYKEALKLEPENKECLEGLQKVSMAILAGSSQEDQKTRAQHAMNDPEIRQILMAPEVQNALKAIQENPKEAMNVLKNPDLASKIEKLIAAGILQVG